MVPLTTRLRLARLALTVPAEDADVQALGPLLHAGVDLLILGDSGEAERDAATLRGFRERWGMSQLLLATANAQAAGLCSADVVYHQAEAPPSRPHGFSLLGCGIHDVDAVASAGESFDFFLLDEAPGSPVLDAALAQQPVFDAASTPWFARTAPQQAAGVIATGARRLAVDRSTLVTEDPAGELGPIASELKRAWKNDPESFGYVSAAFRGRG